MTRVPQIRESQERSHAVHCTEARPVVVYVSWMQPVAHSLKSLRQFFTNSDGVACSNGHNHNLFISDKVLVQKDAYSVQDVNKLPPKSSGMSGSTLNLRIREPF